MNKRIFSIIMAAIMVCSVICVAVPQKASAASKKPYMTAGAAECDYDNKTYHPREKIGDYYIWVEEGSWIDSNFDRLKCAKPLKKGAVKTLKEVNSNTANKKWSHIGSIVVTNGNTIYYAIEHINPSDSNRKATIYKTTVKGGKHKKVKTVKKFCDLAAFYNGKIYYTVANPDYTLYSYDIAKKKTRLEKKHFLLVNDGGYGRYITGSSGDGAEDLIVYDVKTKKSSLIDGPSTSGVVSGKTVYYYTWDGSGYDYVDVKTWTYTIKKCNLSGKNKKNIKKVKGMGLIYLGRKAAYFKDDTGKTKKLTYSTKKFTTVK